MKHPSSRHIGIAAAIFVSAGIACAADGPVEKVQVRATAHFGLDGASIAPKDRDRILAEVGKMSDVTWQTVTATGYTDSTGSKPYNERLSSRRAGAVKTYLVGKGLDAAMIKTVAKAEDAPVASNASASGRAKNRRTEIQFEGIRSTAK